MKVRHQSTLTIAVFAALVATTYGVEPGKPSVSALEVTAYRAIGAKHRNPAIRNDDTLAERFLGSEEREILKNAGSDTVLSALAMDTDAAWASLGVRRPFAKGVHIRARHIDEVFATGELRSRYLPQGQIPQPVTPTGNHICVASVP
jgi:hypothetical protein